MRKSRLKYPRLSFKEMKGSVLGKQYSLSLVFIGDRTSERLNHKYRAVSKPASVLSFPLSEDEGEIFINLRKARDDAHKFNMTFKRFVAYLFIHGMLHLKGMKHGGTMEEEERYLLKDLVP